MITGPLLVTERFDLWQPSGLSDFDGLQRLLADEETRRFLGNGPSDPPAIWDRMLRTAGGWSLYNYGVFYVRPRDSADIIATIGVFHSWRGLDPSLDDQPEAGWVVRRDWWGKGVAGEVMRVVLPWFEETHGAQRIVAMIEPENTASKRVAATLGFRTYATTTATDGAPLDLYERLPHVS